MYSTDREGHLKIQVQFTKPLDRKTLVTGKTVILDAPLDHNAEGKIFWDSIFGKEQLTVISTKRRKELFPSSSSLGRRSDIDLTLTLRGTDQNGSGVITDSEGTPLDGDFNGSPGGDFVLHYSCATTDPVECQ